MTSKTWFTYLIPEDVHDEGEDGDQLEEDESTADNGQGVVQVKVVQKVLEIKMDPISE
jgi:hypothetical protein